MRVIDILKLFLISNMLLACGSKNELNDNSQNQVNFSEKQLSSTFKDKDFVGMLTELMLFTENHEPGIVQQLDEETQDLGLNLTEEPALVKPRKFQTAVALSIARIVALTGIKKKEIQSLLVQGLFPAIEDASKTAETFIKKYPDDYDPKIGLDFEGYYKEDGFTEYRYYGRKVKDTQLNYSEMIPQNYNPKNGIAIQFLPNAETLESPSSVDNSKYLANKTGKKIVTIAYPEFKDLNHLYDIAEELIEDSIRKNAVELEKLKDLNIDSKIASEAFARKNLLFYGKSIGGAVAVELASRYHLKDTPVKLITDRSFKSMGDVVARLIQKELGKLESDPDVPKWVLPYSAAIKNRNPKKNAKFVKAILRTYGLALEPGSKALKNIPKENQLHITAGQLDEITGGSPYDNERTIRISEEGTSANNPLDLHNSNITHYKNSRRPFVEKALDEFSSPSFKWKVRL